MPSELGTYIRRKRTASGMGLREFARLIGRSAPFLTQLELDDDPPPASEETLVAIATALGENPDEFFARANKLPRALAPESAVEVALYRRMKSMSVTEQKRILEELNNKAKPKRHGQ
jgi:transcriptional regulator with XRE-family HTH domain